MQSLLNGSKTTNSKKEQIVTIRTFLKKLKAKIDCVEDLTSPRSQQRRRFQQGTLIVSGNINQDGFSIRNSSIPANQTFDTSTESDDLF